MFTLIPTSTRRQRHARLASSDVLHDAAAARSATQAPAPAPSAPASNTALVKGTFERKEKKYLINDETFERLMELVGNRLEADVFAHSTVTSIYYDTPAFELINRSIEKPIYKEKLRLRTYGAYNPAGPVFVELKKKFKGFVYKRRVQMTHEGACAVMAGMPYEQANAAFPLDPELDTMHHSAAVDAQIGREIDACVARHPGLEASMAIIVERLAFHGIEDADLRITFDVHPRYRTGNLSFAAGPEGRLLLADDVRIMEIKCSGAYPLWLVRALSAVGAYPQSCSKYGMAYAMAKPGVFLGQQVGHAQPLMSDIDFSIEEACGFAGFTDEELELAGLPLNGVPA